MASGIFDDALLRHIWSTDELRATFNDRNRVLAGTRASGWLD
jgi:hypothetical protein